MSDTSQPPLSPGEPRSFGNGRYVVERRLGAGNFATVYLAHDERLAVPVAVKLLSDRWSWEPEVRGRFVQEARLLRSLNDARVVQIRDIAETDDGRPYLVMDFATEGTLEQRMFELAQQQVRLGPFQLRVAARAIADALGVLHERRIAHRDIKPSNMLITRVTIATGSVDPGRDVVPPEAVLLRPGERLMLGDLGLAKDLAFDSGITVGVGTAGYMAPEQALAGAKIDMRTDIFAASALLAQIASGEAPDPMRRVSNGVIEAGRPLPANVPALLGRALLRGLDMDPDQRPQTIEQWLVEVDGALVAVETNRGFAPPTMPTPVVVPAAASAVVAAAVVAAPVVAAPVGAAPVGAAPMQQQRRRWAVIGAAVLVVLAGTGIALALATGGDGPASSSSCPAASTDSVPFSVCLSGPTKIKAGVQARWDVVAPGAVSGTWSLTGPVAAVPSVWSPGNFFQGTWNAPNPSITLTLVVQDANGNKKSKSITFAVE